MIGRNERRSLAARSGGGVQIQTCDVIGAHKAHADVTYLYHVIYTYLHSHELIVTTTDDLVHALRKVADVARVQSCHRYPPVRRHVHMRLIHHRLRLLRVHPRKATPPVSIRAATSALLHT